jgi:hypothetical protein
LVYTSWRQLAAGAMVLLLIGFVSYGALFLPRSVLAQGGEGQLYIVQPDDTLWKIAAKYLGDGRRFNEIVAATQAKRAEDASFARLDRPGLILSGAKLWIPAGAIAPAATAPPASPHPALSEKITQAETRPGQPAATAGDGPGGHIAFSFWNNSPERCTYEIDVIDVQACLSGAEACQASRSIFSLNNASEPALSPDGSRLAFRGWGEIPEKHKNEQLDHPYFDCAAPRAERRLGHTNLDGGGYQGVGHFWEDSHPNWAPDGQRLLFDTGRHRDGIIRIMAISADGQREDDLRIAGQQPSWAPDGERFVYRGCDISGNRCGLWLAKAFPVQAWDLGLNLIGPVLQEPAAAHPDWSPVGEQIVFQSPVNGSWDLYLIQADGSDRRQLTGDPGVEGLPTWSPDGKWVAYLSNAEGNWGIWIIRADGGERHLLFPFDGGIFTPKPITPYFGRDWLDEQISWAR